MKEWVERRGFSVEAYYVSNLKLQDPQGILCATDTVSSQNGGWGLAEKEQGKPYFLTASTAGYESDNTTAATATSASELVHVVAVYDPNAGGTYGKQFLYVNGVCVNAAGEALDGPFVPINSGDFNKFCIGADVSLDSTKSSGVTYQADYSTSRLTLLDAKIYDKALTSAEVSAAHTAAVATTAGNEILCEEDDWKKAYTQITPENDQSKYFYRSKLAAMADQKYVQAYDKIYDALMSFQTLVSGSGVSYDMYRLVLSDHHEIFWSDYSNSGGALGTLYISYFSKLNTAAEVAPYQAKIEAAADALLSRIRPDMTEAERVKYVYDCVMDLVQYGDTEGEFVHTLYGAFIQNAPVCDGYSHTFGYLLQKLGITSFEIVGDTEAVDTNNVGHAWSGVKIGSRYTLFDVTFSDTANSRYKYYDKPAMHSDGSHYPDPKYSTDIGFSLPVFS